MKHHSKFCKWIHGAFFLFDHALGANVKATCIVALYHSDGVLIKFPISMRIFIKEKGKMPWLKRKVTEFKTKNELAIEMIKRALNKGFPECTVLADAWFGVGPFVKALQRLKVSYIV